jgi:crossover junction endodeoxyribonuclease RuvC
VRVLGVDPGTALCGYGVVEEADGKLRLLAHGAICTVARLPLPQRLLTIYADLAALLAEYNPGAVAVEEIFFARNARTALAVGQARGVALLVAAQAGVPVFEYTPLQVKMALTGYGSAPKSQVQGVVRLVLDLGFVPQPDDAADAIAVAICHIHSARLTALLPQPTERI